MKILLIAPHPFFQERGTPIAVKLIAETLCEFGHTVDLLTYHEGSDIKVKGLNLYRIPKPLFANNIPIGFSFKKVIADIYLSFSLVKLITKNNYDVIHAVEESIFPAALINKGRKKLIYDMDSSLADQLLEKWQALSRYQKILDGFEGWAVKKANIVVPVCKSLADKVKQYDPEKKVFVLEDIGFENRSENKEDLRQTLNLKGVVALYAGNLEHYQGIDLILESIAKINSQVPYSVVIIGGKKNDIDKYIEKAKAFGISDKIYFAGPRLLKDLPVYLSQADILLSPRLKGKNTPMKLYSYLISGKPVLATKIESHTQVIDDSCSKLVNPDPEAFAKGFKRLIEDENLRKKIGEAGRLLAKKNYSLESYKLKLKNIYDQLN